MKHTFKKVYIEITNHCNLNCSFCPKTSRKIDYISTEKFEKVIRAVKPYSQYVYFHIMGEPFLHSQLESILNICLDNNIKVNITTNGTLLPNVKDILLNAKSLRKVSFSTHCFKNENEAKAQYLNNIKKFIQEVDGRFIVELRDWNNAGESSSLKISPNVYQSYQKQFNWPDIKKDETNTTAFCYGLRDQFGVLVDGTVVPCCLDSEGTIALGNLYDTPLEEILFSERAKAIYEGFSARKAVEPLCQRCGYAQRFS